MGYQSGNPARSVWDLARRQHGVVTRGQLLELGIGSQGIKHRVARGRLYRVCRGVYSVGRPELTRLGRWMAAVLACGPRALLSHRSAAALWEVSAPWPGPIEVVVCGRPARRPGIKAHTRSVLAEDDISRHHGIPVTAPFRTLVDLATVLERDDVEAAVNAVVKRRLAGSEAIREQLAAVGPLPGVRQLKSILDRQAFRLTDSRLERWFLPLVRRAGLPPPVTQVWVNDFRVDFHWPDLRLVVETDGLEHHRSAADQAKDRIRDQTHTAAGLTCLRFTHAQVRFEPDYVVSVLARVAERLG